MYATTCCFFGSLKVSKCWCLFGLIGLISFVADSATAQTKRISFKGEALYSGEKTLKIPGILSKPKGNGPFPAILLMPHCGGMKSNVTRLWPNYLRKLGYVTLTIDNLSPRGLKLCNRKLVRNVQTQVQDAMGGLRYLSELSYVDKNNVGAIGYSMGGFTLGFIGANNLGTKSGVKLKAGILLYSGCHHIENNPLFPMLVVSGSREKFVPLCETKSEMYRSMDMRVIPNAYHAFDQSRIKKIRKDPGGTKMLYSAKATKQAQVFVKEFLSRHLK